MKIYGNLHPNLTPLIGISLACLIQFSSCPSRLCTDPVVSFHSLCQTPFSSSGVSTSWSHPHPPLSNLLYHFFTWKLLTFAHIFLWIFSINIWRGKAKNQNIDDFDGAIWDIHLKRDLYCRAFSHVVHIAVQVCIINFWMVLILSMLPGQFELFCKQVSNKRLHGLLIAVRFEFAFDRERK